MNKGWLGLQGDFIPEKLKEVGWRAEGSCPEVASTSKPASLSNSHKQAVDSDSRKHNRDDGTLSTFSFHLFWGLSREKEHGQPYHAAF